MLRKDICQNFGIYISVVECFGGQYHVNKMVKHEKELRMSHDCKKCILRHITELQFKRKNGNSQPTGPAMDLFYFCVPMYEKIA